MVVCIVVVSIVVRSIDTSFFFMSTLNALFRKKSLMNEHTYLYDYAIDESVFASFGFERYTTDGDWKDRLLGSIEERFAYSSPPRGWWSGSGCYSLQDVKENYETIMNTEIVTGFGQTFFGTSPVSSEDSRQYLVIRFVDSLIRLASYLGLVNVRNAEHNFSAHYRAAYKPFRVDASVIRGLIDKIDTVLGVPLRGNRFGGNLYGFRHRQTALYNKHLEGLYAALRIKDVMDRLGRTDAAVCEIGGGAGYVCLFLQRMLPVRYQIMDLTNSNVVQYILLANEFGADEVNFNGNNPRGRISLTNVLLPENAANTDTIDADIVVNQDSFPELGKKDVLAYLSRIKHGGYFLSINQESEIPDSNYDDTLQHNVRQNNVHHLCQSLNFELVYRNLSWIRSGYVDELWISKK